MRWLFDNDAATVAEEVAGFFPDVEQELILRAVARYKEQGTWPADARLNPPEYEGLQDILINAGLAKYPQPYRRIVRPAFAEAALE